MQKSSSNSNSKISLMIDGCQSFLDVIIADLSLDDKKNEILEDSIIEQENT